MMKYQVTSGMIFCSYNQIAPTLSDVMTVVV